MGHLGPDGRPKSMERGPKVIVHELFRLTLRKSDPCMSSMMIVHSVYPLEIVGGTCASIIVARSMAWELRGLTNLIHCVQYHLPRDLHQT